MPKIRLFNPRRRNARRRANKKKHVRRKRNLGGGTLTFMSNRKYRNRNSKKKNRRRRNRNPFGLLARKHKHHGVRRRRHNPFGLTWSGIGIQTVAAIGSGILTRSLPQALLGAKNTGVMGYAANAGTAVVCTFIANKVSPGLGNAALLGGATMIAGRLAEDFIGQKLIDYGQVNLPLPSLSGVGDRRYSLAGDFVPDFNYRVPTSSLANGRKQICPPVAPAPAKAMGLWKGAWKN